jgi:hypothetical protein
MTMRNQERPFWVTARIVRGLGWQPAWAGYEYQRLLPGDGGVWRVCHKVLAQVETTGNRERCRFEATATIWPPTEIRPKSVRSLGQREFCRSLLREIASRGYSGDWIESDVLGLFANFTKRLGTLPQVLGEVRTLEALGPVPPMRVPPRHGHYASTEPGSSRAAGVAKSVRGVDAFWALSDSIRNSSTRFEPTDAAYNSQLEMSRWDSRWTVSCRLEIGLHAERNLFRPPYAFKVDVRHATPTSRREEERLLNLGAYKTLLSEFSRIGYHGRWTETQSGLAAKVERSTWSLQCLRNELDRWRVARAQRLFPGEIATGGSKRVSGGRRR